MRTNQAIMTAEKKFLYIIVTLIVLLSIQAFLPVGMLYSQIPTFNPTEKKEEKKTPVNPPEQPSPGNSGDDVSDVPGGTGKKFVKFYGMEVKGQNVVFLLDVSGSMASAGVEKKSRINILKAQLHNMLDAFIHDKMRSDRSYKLYTFSDNVDSFPVLKFAKMGDKAAYDQAQRFIVSIAPKGGTSMLLAWKKLFEDKDAWKIDTVYFLSDGEPTDCTHDELLKHIKSGSKRIQINCISIGAPSALLRKIAEDNRGTYTESL